MLTVLAATVAGLGAPAAAHAAVPWAPCAEPSAPTLQCGAITVPLDRGGAVPGAVTLNVRRIPATAAPSDTAVLALAGRFHLYEGWSAAEVPAPNGDARLGGGQTPSRHAKRGGTI